MCMVVDYWVILEGGSGVFIDFLFLVVGFYWVLKMMFGVCYKRKKKKEILRFILRF